MGDWVYSDIHVLCRRKTLDVRSRVSYTRESSQPSFWIICTIVVLVTLVF